MSSTLDKLRSHRIGGFAIFDFTTAFAGMYLAAPLVGISRERAMWLTIPIGIATHELFMKKRTPLNEMVLGDKPNRVAQLAVAVMLFKGLS